ncbi:DMT family transporter [Candidatus Babeliales bacterium]|nr:DMT family transporter [Candidatus Babeliales bacterium]
MITILLFYGIMAGVYTFGKQTMLYGSPFFLTGIRITFGGLCFLGYQYYKERSKFYIKKEWVPLIAFYSAGILIMDSCRMFGLKYIPSSNAAIIATTAPFIAAFFSWWQFNEKMTKKKIIALIVGFLGVMPLLFKHLRLPHESLHYVIISYCAIFISTIGFIMCGMMSKILIQKKGAPFFMIVGTVMTGGGTLALIASAFCEPWNPVPITNFHAILPLLVYLIATHSLIAYPLYSYLVQKYPITLVAFAQLTTPFFTALLSYFFMNETISWPFFISLAILSGSLALFYHEEKEEGLIKDNPKIP